MADEEQNLSAACTDLSSAEPITEAPDLLDSARRFLAVNDEFDRRARLGDAGAIEVLAGARAKNAAELRADGIQAMKDLRAAIAQATGEGR